MGENNNQGQTNSDKIQRQMEFIVNQQAQFEIDIARLERQTVEATTNISKLTDVVLSLANIVERHDQQIAMLIEHSKKTDEQIRSTDGKMNALINIVERMLGDQGAS